MEAKFGRAETSPPEPDAPTIEALWSQGAKPATGDETPVCLLVVQLAEPEGLEAWLEDLSKQWGELFGSERRPHVALFFPAVEKSAPNAMKESIESWCASEDLPSLSAELFPPQVNRFDKAAAVAAHLLGSPPAIFAAAFSEDSQDGLCTVVAEVAGLRQSEYHPACDALKTPMAPWGFDRTAALRELGRAQSELNRAAIAKETPGEIESPLLCLDGQDVRPSPLFSYYRRLIDKSPAETPHCAMADLLERRWGTDDANEKAAALRDSVRHFVKHRIWALNRAPELVVHDERHAERVDYLLAQLVEALLLAAQRRHNTFPLSLDDIYHLSLAAWLHDWGHVGCRYEGEGGGVVSDPFEVRRLHGLLTNELLQDPACQALHGLADETKTIVGLLCAFHQGWTSLDDTIPVTDPDNPKDAASLYQNYFLREPPTLFGKVEDVLRNVSPKILTRYQLMCALLRVADASDLGAHRAPDLAAHKAFLEMRLADQHAKLAVHLEAQAKDQWDERTRGLTLEAWAANDTRYRGRLCPPSNCTQQTEDAIRLLVKYLDYLVEQTSHVLKHARIDSVALSVTKADDHHLELGLQVLPSEYRPGGAEPSAAAQLDLDRELSLSYKNAFNSKQRTVRGLFEHFGLEFSRKPADPSLRWSCRT